MPGLMDRLGLGRRDLRAWAMYDWANSAVQTTIIAAIFPIYFQKVAAADHHGTSVPGEHDHVVHASERPDGDPVQLGTGAQPKGVADPCRGSFGKGCLNL